MRVHDCLPRRYFVVAVFSSVFSGVVVGCGDGGGGLRRMCGYLCARTLVVQLKFGGVAL